MISTEKYGRHGVPWRSVALSSVLFLLCLLRTKLQKTWRFFTARMLCLRGCIYALVIARFGVQYGQYFPSFSYFADLFHEPLGE